MDLSCLYLPSAFKKLHKPTKKYSIAKQSMRRMWHKLYDGCPTLMNHLGDKANNTFDVIQEYNICNAGNNNYLFHIKSALWIKHNLEIDDNKLEDEILQELLTSAVAEWTRADIGEFFNIVLVSGFSEKGKGVWGEKRRNCMDDFSLHEIEWLDFASTNSIYVATTNNINDLKGREEFLEYRY